jgi:hypothetical protein
VKYSARLDIQSTNDDGLMEVITSKVTIMESFPVTESPQKFATGLKMLIDESLKELIKKEQQWKEGE